VSFAAADAGFLNDVARGPDGALYVTDTGRNRIYRIAGGILSVAIVDSALASPNGITWDGRSAHLVVVPYGGDRTIHAWTPGGTTLRPVGTSATGGRYDGVEVRADGSTIVASQADSSIHVFRDGTGTVQFHVAGRPADIGYDTRRNRVVIPYIARNRVEIYQLR
jgi:sugar lactone lactonase YvrE